MKRFLIAMLGVVVLGFATTSLGAVNIHFTADDVVSTMAAQGAPLSDSNYQWGLWAVRVMPTGISGGGYTITGGATNQAGWGVNAPNGAYGAAPYTASNSAWFWDASGAEAGYPANPLYMMMDKPADTFTSYFGNTVTPVMVDSFFDVFFEIDLGATWDGTWQFVVDGSKYASGTSASPGGWVADFFGGYGTGGGLANNMGAGYQVVPEPATILVWGLLGAVAAGYGVWRRKRAA